VLWETEACASNTEFMTSLVTSLSVVHVHCGVRCNVARWTDCVCSGKHTSFHYTLVKHTAKHAEKWTLQWQKLQSHHEHRKVWNALEIRCLMLQLAKLLIQHKQQELHHSRADHRQQRRPSDYRGRVGGIPENFTSGDPALLQLGELHIVSSLCFSSVWTERQT